MSPKIKKFLKAADPHLDEYAILYAMLTYLIYVVATYPMGGSDHYGIALVIIAAIWLAIAKVIRKLNKE